MFKSIFKSPGALFYAILVHVILFAILTVSLDWSSEPEEAAAPVNIVKATSVDEKKVEDQLKKLIGAHTVYQQVAYLMRSGEPDALDRMVAISYANLAVD